MLIVYSMLIYATSSRLPCTVSRAADAGLRELRFCSQLLHLRLRRVRCKDLSFLAHKPLLKVSSRYV